MHGAWDWIEAHGGILLLVSLPFAIGAAVVFLAMVYMLVGIPLEAIITGFRHRVHLVDERLIVHAASRQTNRELAEMENRGEVMWRPSPIIESTRPGFREDEI